MNENLQQTLIQKNKNKNSSTPATNQLEFSLSSYAVFLLIIKSMILISQNIKNQIILNILQYIVLQVMGQVCSNCRGNNFEVEVGELPLQIQQKVQKTIRLSNGLKARTIPEQNRIVFEPNYDPKIMELTKISDNKTNQQIEADTQEILKIQDQTQRILHIHNFMRKSIYKQYKHSQQNTPAGKQDLENDKTNTNQDILPTDFQEISDVFKSNKIDINWTPKKNLATSLSLHYLTGSMGKMLRCQYNQPKNMGEFKSLFDKDKLQNHYTQVKNKIAKKLGVDEEKITILDISKGSIKTCFVFDANYLSKPQQNDAKKNHIFNSFFKVHPYFQSFQLSYQDFDVDGNYDYSIKASYKDQLRKQIYKPEERAGQLYQKPLGCKRFGLRVIDKYHDINWISQTDKNQWVNCYHGVGTPNQQIEIIEGKVKRLNQILRSRELKPGNRNAYQGEKCIKEGHNEDCKIPEAGLYVTPHIQTALSFANPLQVQKSKKKYKLVFQCKVRPGAYHAVKTNFSQQIYWIVESPEDIRPFGILLRKMDDIEVKQQS